MSNDPAPTMISLARAERAKRAAATRRRNALRKALAAATTEEEREAVIERFSKR